MNLKKLLLLNRYDNQCGIGFNVYPIEAPVIKVMNKRTLSCFNIPLIKSTNIYINPTIYFLPSQEEGMPRIYTYAHRLCRGALVSFFGKNFF